MCEINVSLFSFKTLLTQALGASHHPIGFSIEALRHDSSISR